MKHFSMLTGRVYSCYSVIFFCSRGAFESASKHFIETDVELSMAGRSFLITGANSGIGKAVAMAIAKKGTKVCVVYSTNKNTYTYTYTYIDTVKDILLSCCTTCFSGGTIHMVCRNKEKAEETRAEIIKESGNKVRSRSPAL